MTNPRAWLAAAVVLLTELGVVLSHVWAREDHAHVAHRPWLDGLE